MKKIFEKIEVKDVTEMERNQPSVSNEKLFTSEEIVSSEELILMEIENSENQGYLGYFRVTRS